MSPRIYKEPFAQIPEWVVRAKISDRGVRLFCLLDRYADSERRAFPSKKTLAADLDCAVSSVERALRELVEIDAVWLEPTHRADGSQGPNNYWLWPATPGDLVMGEDPPPHVSGGGSPPLTKQEEREPENESQSSATAGPDVAALDADDEPLDMRAMAQSIVRRVWEAKNPKPATPYIGCVKIAEALLNAGHAPGDVEQAMMVVPTISTRWVEAEIGKRRRQAPRQRNVDQNREGPSGRIDL